MIESRRKTPGCLSWAWLFILAWVHTADGAPGQSTLLGHVPAVTARLTPQGRLPATNRLHLAIGLPLRNPTGLDELLHRLYDPGSTNFHQFLTPPQFAARFGPAETDYQALITFAETHGLTVTDRHPNRVVLEVDGKVADIEKAFNIVLLTYRHPTEPRDFFAPDVEPSVPTNLAVVTVEGLSDYGLPKPLTRKLDPTKIRPLGGSGPSGYYAGNDFRNAYAPGTTLTGLGQTVGLLEFSDYFPTDITSYENTIGLTNPVPLNTIVIGHPGPGTANNAEVALDIEVAIAIAPGLSQVIVYEIKSGASSILNRMATDNLAKQLSSSWTWGGGPSATIDAIFQQMAAQGQSFFQASGDSDAYTGAQPLDNSSQTTAPVDSPNITCVGGSTLTMSGVGKSWSSEKVWNYSPLGGTDANVGSGGGISSYYAIPNWQANVSMASNSGSTTSRNIPDVAMTADSVYVAYNNGSSGGFAGTSCAAPLWAGFCALVNQQAAVASGTTVGFLNPALYAIGASGSYGTCFHDITTGNNIGTNTPGLFNAVAGYDLCTGLGTPSGTNLINALAPYLYPSFLVQPSSQTVTNGAAVAFSASVAGQSPLTYYWLFNGTNLPAGGTISGSTSNVLSINGATPSNSGNYQLLVTNSYGSATSSVAVLTVGFAPAFSAQPTNLTVLSGSNAVFSATLSGSAPLVYQWRKNGVNLSNGTGISGATTNLLSLSGVTTNSAGNYTLFVTNSFGVGTSSAAALTVVLPPAITSGLTNQTLECGGNTTFSITASGTPPLSCQWSLDGSPLAGATNTSLSLANVHLPNHTVTLALTNLYGSVTSNALLTVRDTLAPIITMNGGNPAYVEFGTSFADPGASATDLCAGPLPVSTSGTVNTNAVGTNLLTYAANDGNGNSNSLTRAVVVRDTLPPTILWSFTNLVLAADTNCTTAMPDVTGTNFILASDLSAPLTFLQSPAANTALPLGTNLIVITVLDACSNAAFATNTILVRDQLPPVIVVQPPSQTNFAGSTATLSVTAMACTPLAYQWFFSNAAMTGQTNSTLSLSPVGTSNAGNYFVISTAAGGSSTSAVAELTVNLVPTSLALNSCANPAGYQDSLNFTALLSPTNAAGTIQFLTNGILFDRQALTAGQTTSTHLTVLPRGTNLIVAIYSGDANDAPATNTLAQIITNHPPMVATAFYRRAAGSGLSLALTDLATNWTDIDGDPLLLAGVSVSTNGVTLTNDAGTLNYFDPNDVADQFTCTISDGWGGTNFQTVNIAVTPPPGRVPTFTGLIANPDGSIGLSMSGAPGDTYILQTATNLLWPLNWLPLATNTVGTNSAWQFNDGQATNFPQRFYRLQLAP